MNLSIRSTALIAAIVPLLSFALVTGLTGALWRFGDLRAELENNAARSLAYLVDTSRFSLLVGDQQSLVSQARATIGATQDAVAVVFRETDGRRIAAAGPEVEISALNDCLADRSACPQRHRRYLVVGDVTGLATDPDSHADLAVIENAPSKPSGQRIGQVLMSFDLSRIQAQQRQRVIDVVVMTVLASLLGLLLGLTLSRRLTTPIRGLSEVVSRIQGGELSARIRPTGSGELRSLEDGVNSMARQVEEASRSLQRRVEEVTAEQAQTLQDLEKRNRELNAARERAEAASRAKDLFLARMSHELRTPLASVVGYVRLIRDEVSAARRSQFCQFIEDGAALLQAVIDDVLNFAKLQQDALRLEKREFDLSGALENAVIMQGPAAHAKNLELDCLLDNRLPRRVIGDAVRLAQILNNLLGNAVKFTDYGDVQVRVSSELVSETRCRIEIQVSDSGVGIGGIEQEQLFEPFSQADESTARRFGGSGLGLSISRRLARQMNGDITLKDREFGGTVACATLEFDVVEYATPMRRRRDRPLQVLIVGGTDACIGTIAHYLAEWQPRIRRMNFERVTDIVSEKPPELLILADYRPGHVSRKTLREAYSGPLLLLARESELGMSGTNPGDGVPILSRPIRKESLQNAVAALLSKQSTSASYASTERVTRYRCTVLVAEDNDLNRRMVSDQLGRYGAQVVACADATDALEKLNQKLVDFILMDVHMPGMTGVELARAIGARAPELPLYALTANVMGTEETALRHAGVREILHKPLTHAMIERLLGQHGELRDDESDEVKEPSPAYGPVIPRFDPNQLHDELDRLRRGITDAFDARDWPRAAFLVHDLHGVVRMGGLDTIVPLARALEFAVNDSDLAEAGALLAQINRQLRS